MNSSVREKGLQKMDRMILFYVSLLSFICFVQPQYVWDNFPQVSVDDVSTEDYYVRFLENKAPRLIDELERTLRGDPDINDLGRRMDVATSSLTGAEALDVARGVAVHGVPVDDRAAQRARPSCAATHRSRRASYGDGSGTQVRAAAMEGAGRGKEGEERARGGGREGEEKGAGRAKGSNSALPSD